MFRALCDVTAGVTEHSDQHTVTFTGFSFFVSNARLATAKSDTVILCFIQTRFLCFPSPAPPSESWTPGRLIVQSHAGSVAGPADKHASETYFFF